MKLQEIEHHISGTHNININNSINIILLNSGILRDGESFTSVLPNELDSRIKQFETCLRKIDMEPKKY